MTYPLILVRFVIKKINQRKSLFVIDLWCLEFDLVKFSFTTVIVDVFCLVSHPCSTKISASPQRMKMVQNHQYWFYGWERKVDSRWCVRAHSLVWLQQLPFCELVSSNIIEWDEAIDRYDLPKDTPIGEGLFNQIEEKMVLDITLKVLQN